MNIREMRHEIRHSLTPYVGEAEAAAMASVIMEEVKGYTPTQLLIHSERELLPDTVERIRRIISRICSGEPMQYVLGTARFRGRDFAVGPGVLIPRPETAQLVDMIVDDFSRSRDVRVLDIGTGSGCIAISLAIDLPFSVVDAIDISQDALDIASDNASKLHTRVNLMLCDINNVADCPAAKRDYDIIVSNPPYILESERATMDPRVYDHEPECALFVSDIDPIGIYRSIAQYAIQHLNASGKLYLEINPLCAAQIRQLLTQQGFRSAEILSDYKGNKRFAIATV